MLLLYSPEMASPKKTTLPVMLPTKMPYVVNVAASRIPVWSVVRLSMSSRRKGVGGGSWKCFWRRRDREETCVENDSTALCTR